MKSSLLLSLLLSVSLSLLHCQTASAVKLLGEDFAYPDGNFNGTQNGGFSLNASNQWTSGWTFSGQSNSGIDAWRVDAGRANAPGNNLAPTHGSRQTGTISRSFTTDQAPGTTLYFSFDLARRNDDEGSYATTLQFLGGQVEVGVRNDARTARVGGNTVTTGNPAAMFDATYVARLAFDAVGSNEVLTVWQDPTSEMDLPLLIAQADLGQLTLGSTLVLNKVDQDNNEFWIDNFQLGTDFDFSDPVVIPEPGTLAIWSLVGLVAAVVVRQRGRMCGKS